jgi:glycosyltransferase involved in cell wall biosynthesis
MGSLKEVPAMNTNNLRVDMITLYFYPDKASTANLLTDLAVGLKEKGCDIRVYTGYPSYWDTKSKASKRENYKGVKIYRVFNTQFDSRKKYGMICNGISFCISVFWKLLRSNEDRIFLMVTTPPFLPYIGYILNKLRGRDYIIIVYDIHPDITIKIGYMKDGILAKIWGKTYSWIYENSVSIIVLGQCMAGVIREKIQKASYSKIKVIQNWEDENFIMPLNKRENWFSKKHNLIDKFVVLYSGNMGQHHNLEPILEAAENLKTEKIKFLFIGEGIQKEKLVKETKSMNLGNVEFLPFQPKENLPYTMTCGDVIIVSQEEDTEGLCVSCKLYTAMAAGRPILAIIGENSEVARVVNEYNCGIVVSNGNANSIAKALIKLQKDKTLCDAMGENARRAFEDNFTKSHAVNKYYEVIKNLFLERKALPKEKNQT